MGTTETPGRSSTSPSAAPSVAPLLNELELGLVVAGDEPRVVPQGDLPFRALGDDPGPRERATPGAVQQPPGVVEVEVTHRHHVHTGRIEAGATQRGQDGLARVAAHRPVLLVDPLADARLHEDPTGRRLDDQAVEGLEEPMLAVDLVGDRGGPRGDGARARRAPRRRSGTCRPGRDATRVPPPRSPTSARASLMATLSRPRSRRASGRGRLEVAVEGRRGRLRLALVACEPSPAEPYGRSTALDISRKLIWPIFIPQ